MSTDGNRLSRSVTDRSHQLLESINRGDIALLWDFIYLCKVKRRLQPIQGSTWSHFALGTIIWSQRQALNGISGLDYCFFWITSVFLLKMVSVMVSSNCSFICALKTIEKASWKQIGLKSIYGVNVVIKKNILVFRIFNNGSFFERRSILTFDDVILLRQSSK